MTIEEIEAALSNANVKYERRSFKNINSVPGVRFEFAQNDLHKVALAVPEFKHYIRPFARHLCFEVYK